MHRGKVDPGVNELPQGNEFSRDHVNRPLVHKSMLAHNITLNLTIDANSCDVAFC